MASKDLARRQNTNPERVDDKDQDKLRILLAEDNVVNQKVAKRVLEKKGFHVTIAENGQVALEILEIWKFDLILMDVQMPLMDGLKTTQIIRMKEVEQDKGCHIPIVAMTAHAMMGDREKCLNSGMDGYVSKPVDSIKLYEVINEVLEKFHPHSTVRE